VLKLYSRSRKNSDDCHHSIIFVSENVAVIDEVPDIHAAEIHAHFDAWIGPRPVPERNLDHIEKLAIGLRHRHAISLEELEMDLVHMELMIFPGPVFDGPILHRSLSGRDCWRVGRIEQRRCGTVDGYEEVRRARGVGGV